MYSLALDSIDTCIQEAVREADCARRRNFRVPFFRPLTLTHAGDGSTAQSAFARDISRQGIGLMHAGPIPLGSVQLAIPTELGRIAIDADVCWCAPCGGGWFYSGGAFSGLWSLDATALLWSTLAAETQRRLKQRYPLFKPVAVTTHDGEISDLIAFSRDISSNGVGLVHNRPLHRQRVMLAIPTSMRSCEVCTEILWCRPCGADWYVSGGRFLRSQFEELPSLLM